MINTENQQPTEPEAFDKNIQRASRHVIKNINRGVDEMRAVPGIQVPVLHEGEFDAVQTVLAEQGIEVVVSERSHNTDDTGDRIRVVSVEDQDIAERIADKNEQAKAKEDVRAEKRIAKIAKYVEGRVNKGIFEMRAVPGIQVPVLHDGELDAIQSKLDDKGIDVSISERSNSTEDAGTRLRANVR